MSEREGLYCEKHVRWCADGVCADCAPVEPFAFWRSGPPKPMAPGELLRQMNAMWVKMSERECDHAAGYCKDTAHKYELPTETIPETPTQKKTRAALIGCGLAALADWHWTPVE